MHMISKPCIASSTVNLLSGHHHFPTVCRFLQKLLTTVETRNWISPRILPSCLLTVLGDTGSFLSLPFLSLLSFSIFLVISCVPPYCTSGFLSFSFLSLFKISPLQAVDPKMQHFCVDNNHELKTSQ